MHSPPMAIGGNSEYAELLASSYGLKWGFAGIILWGGLITSPSLLSSRCASRGREKVQTIMLFASALIQKVLAQHKLLHPLAFHATLKALRAKKPDPLLAGLNKNKAPGAYCLLQVLLCI